MNWIVSLTLIPIQVLSNHRIELRMEQGLEQLIRIISHCKTLGAILDKRCAALLESSKNKFNMSESSLASDSSLPSESSSLPKVRSLTRSTTHFYHHNSNTRTQVPIHLHENKKEDTPDNIPAPPMPFVPPPHIETPVRCNTHSFSSHIQQKLETTYSYHHPHRKRRSLWRVRTNHPPHHLRFCHQTERRRNSKRRRRRKILAFPRPWRFHVSRVRLLMWRTRTKVMTRLQMMMVDCGYPWQMCWVWKRSETYVPKHIMSFDRWNFWNNTSKMRFRRYRVRLLSRRAWKVNVCHVARSHVLRLTEWDVSSVMQCSVKSVRTRNSFPSLRLCTSPAGLTPMRARRTVVRVVVVIMILTRESVRCVMFRTVSRVRRSRWRRYVLVF